MTKILFAAELARIKLKGGEVPGPAIGACTRRPGYKPSQS